MSDTIQTVRWNLGKKIDVAERMWLPDDVHVRERPNELLWQSIRRTGIESQLRRAFRVTDPLWYGFWIDSPLSDAQCRVLLARFTDVGAAVPQYRDPLKSFLDAIARSIETAEQLHVELTPPGHVDMGWITTFAHCPRCKAYPPKSCQKGNVAEVVKCPTCDFLYSPAATVSGERIYFATSVECGECHTPHRVKDFSEEEIQILEDHHHHRKLCEELTWLRRVAAFYLRHPGYEGKIKSNLAAFYQLKVQKGVTDGEEVDEFVEPANSQSKTDWSAEDREVIEYLRYHHFSLQPRWKHVEKWIDRLRPIVAETWVSCPACGGKLR